VDTEQKLNILADSSKFDLACACKYAHEPPRLRGPHGRWIYPAALPSGRKVFLLKTLQTNNCVNDCSYCPFNQTRDVPRCRLAPEDLARTFIQLRNGGLVTGLFLSSGVGANPDTAMADMLATVELLRKRHKYKGFVHLKVIPGAAPAAIEQAVRLATRVSVNIEAPNAKRLSCLSNRKPFHEDIIAAMRTITRCREEINRKCSQTTQFVVGAAGETDREIVRSTAELYRQMKMERVYFSAYQDFSEQAPADKQVNRGSQPMLFDDMTAASIANRAKSKRGVAAGAPDDAEASAATDGFVREHRLYQVDFLLRKYGFAVNEISFDKNNNLSLARDPKRIWADHHPEFFPVDVNRAERGQLLRVPGIGPVGARRIIAARREHRIGSVDDLKSLGVRSGAARAYLAT